MCRTIHWDCAWFSLSQGVLGTYRGKNPDSLEGPGARGCSPKVNVARSSPYQVGPPRDEQGTLCREGL